MVSIFVVVVSTPDGAVSGFFAFTVVGSVVVSVVSIFVVIVLTSDVSGLFNSCGFRLSRSL